jgi:sugar lactone lactonase YvrE
MPGTVRWDRLDTTGVLHCLLADDRVYRLHPGGTVDVYLDDPTAEYMNSPTNVCFGGRDGRRLYVAGLCGWSIARSTSRPRAVLP